MLWPSSFFMQKRLLSRVQPFLIFSFSQYLFQNQSHYSFFAYVGDLFIWKIFLFVFYIFVSIVQNIPFTELLPHLQIMTHDDRRLAQ